MRWVTCSGAEQEDRVMLEVKGTRTPAVVEAVRASYPHRCTRVDSCADFDAPGAFDRVLGAVMDAKKDHRLYGESRGDWDDFPELGRTQYLGAATSPVKLRLYEKGKQPEYRHLNRSDWCRLEIQVRPQKEAKQAYAGLSALEVWGRPSGHGNLRRLSWLNTLIHTHRALSGRSPRGTRSLSGCSSSTARRWLAWLTTAAGGMSRASPCARCSRP